MRALSLPQPWASLVASGMIDVFSKSWKTDYSGDVLIVANHKKATQSMLATLPIEWLMRVNYAQMTGWLADFDTLPYGAALGVFVLDNVVPRHEVEDCEPRSVWDEGQTFRWKISRVQRFDYPILGVVARSNLYEFEAFNTGNLPARQDAQLPLPSLDGDVLTLQVNKTIWEELSVVDGEANFYIEDLQEYRSILFDSRGGLQPISRIVLTCEDKKLCFGVVKYHRSLLGDDEGMPLRGRSLLSGQDETYPIIEFFLKCNFSAPYD